MAKTQKVKAEQNHAQTQARAQLNCIIEMLAAYDQAEQSGKAKYEGDFYDADGMRELIEQNALSVEVRSDWHIPGSKEEGSTEYRICLCTGGPAVQVVGELSEHGEPETARLQYQDWFTPWEDYRETTDEEDAALLRYVQFYYFSQ